MALPVPTRCDRIDACRDGSLSASFFADDGAFFNLTLPVRKDAAASTPRRYDPPELERVVPHLYMDKFTGGQHGYETRESVTLAWEDGEALLARLAPLPVEHADQRDAALLAEMAAILAARGALAASP